MKAKVEVFLKDGVLDVQGKAVENALHGLGWTGTDKVRVGRVITFEVAATSHDAARGEVEAMCERLLANPVIESWRVEIAA
ncbi:MAG TPA: phosphoribosylformylglycinamidine synthase subunit PurS [Caulobacteraceae bacterium]|jgi:phosphoribosylformylglycinamidine synthase